MAIVLNLMLPLTALAEPTLANDRPRSWFSPCYDGSAFRFVATFESGENLIQSSDGKRATFDGTNKDDACAGNGRVPLPQGFRLGRTDILTCLTPLLS